MQKCSFADSPLAAKQTFKQATVLNAFTTSDRRSQELFLTKDDFKGKVWYWFFSSCLMKIKAVFQLPAGSSDVI